MPAKKRPDPLYQRGSYKLYRRPDRESLEIVWYDEARKRERSKSASTADIGQARLALDRLYLADSEHRFCPTCHRPWEHSGSPLLLTAINDYLILSERKPGIKSAKTRLAHVGAFIIETNQDMLCVQATEAWVNQFRDWMGGRKQADGSPYSLSHIEGCVMQLAAVINSTPGEQAAFKAEQQKAVTNSPTYRADVKTLAAMFNYCLRPEARTEKERAYLTEARANLLNYLRMAVATWARPDAIFDITDKQWASEARVLDLNPPGRRQTKKHRPKVPIARQLVPFLDAMEGPWIPITVLNQPWSKMARKLKLPTGRQAGPKLIRRSMATIVRKRIGEANWQQGKMMLGHVRFDVSDIYAIPDPANLGLALEATESVIDEIEALAPGSYRTVTATGVALKLVEGGRNG